VHDDALFRLVDQWVTGLSADHFVQVLPLVRRTFATFPAPARRQIGERVKRETGNGSLAGPAASTEDWNMARAEALIPTLRRILGIESST
jgi:TctA family transporter